MRRLHEEALDFADPGFVIAPRARRVAAATAAGSFRGTIKNGRVAGNRLYFDWEWGPNYGQAVLEALADGTLNGTWGYREARSGAGTWTGRRR